MPKKNQGTEKFSKILILILFILVLMSYFIDYKKTEYYLQQDIHEFVENNWIFIQVIFISQLILIYLFSIKFKIRENLNRLKFFSIVTLLAVIMFKAMIISLLLFINRLGVKEELKIDYIYTKDLEFLINKEDRSGSTEEIIVYSSKFKNAKKVRKQNREVVTLNFNKGLLGINYLK